MSHKCAICEKEDWHSLDHLRNKQYWFNNNTLFDEQIGFKICKKCGFVTYSPRWSEDEIKAKYTNDRGRVVPQMLIAAAGKAEFHKKMLGEHLALDAPLNILDVGCAFGGVRDVFPNAIIEGIEYAKGLANYAKEVNEIIIIDDLAEANPAKDLVMLYHVIEHISDPRGDLLAARALLKDDGYLYIALPIWFNNLESASGAKCLDFEYYYHLNHNNVFSYKAIKNLLAITGFKIVAQDKVAYGYAFVCQKSEVQDIVLEDCKEIMSHIENDKKAVELLSRANPNSPSIEIIEQAIAIEPKYPTAYILLSIQKGIYEDINKVMHIYDRAIKAVGYNLQIELHFASIVTNWCDAGKINNWIKLAVKMYEKVLSHHPGNPESWVHLMRIYANHYKDKEKAEYCAEKLLSIDPMQWSHVEETKGLLYC